MAVGSERRTLEIILSGKNASASAFAQIHASLARVSQVGRQAFAGLGAVAGSARAQLLGVVAALGGIQKLILEPAAFEETLARISVGSRALEGDIDRVRTAIEELAVSTGTAREDLAQGFDAAGRSAKNFEEVLSLVTTANKLSTLTGGNVRDSVVELSQVMEGFGKDISEVEEVAAKLFETSRGTAGNFIGELAQIGPQAKDAGVSLEQLLAAIETAEGQGVKATATLTGLRTILDQIVNPTEKLAETFERLGIQTGQQALAGKNLGEVFARMARGTRELEENFGDLGIGGRALGTFLAIGAEEGAKFNEVLDNLATSTVPEFNAAFVRVDDATNSLIAGFRELAKIAATAFAGTQFGDLDAILKEAAGNIDRVRIQAQIAGLEFSKWREKLLPSVETVKAFFLAFKTGLDTLVLGAKVLQAGIGRAMLEFPLWLADMKRGLAELRFWAFLGSLEEVEKAQREHRLEIEKHFFAVQEWKKEAADALDGLSKTLVDNAQAAATAWDGIGANVDESAEKVAKLDEQIRALQKSLLELNKPKQPLIVGFTPEEFERLRSSVPTTPRAGPTVSEVVTQGGVTKPLDPIVEDTKQRIADARAAVAAVAEQVTSMADQIRSTVQGAFAAAFDGLIQGTLTAKEAIRGFATSMLSELNRLAANQIFQSIFGGGVGGAGAPAGGFFTAIASIFAAKGGIFPGQFMPVQAFAGGGVVTRPTIGIVREAGQNEAVVPLPNGRSIPVDMRGGAGVVHNHYYNIQAMDGDSVKRVLTSYQGRQAFETNARVARATRNDFRK